MKITEGVDVIPKLIIIWPVASSAYELQMTT